MSTFPPRDSASRFGKPEGGFRPPSEDSPREDPVRTPSDDPTPPAFAPRFGGGDSPARSGGGSQGSGSGNWYWASLILVAIVLVPAEWTILKGAYDVTTSFFGYGENPKTDIGMAELKSVFTIMLALIASIITLFTPSKNLKSPLNYFAKKIQEKAQTIKGQTDPEKRKQAVVATMITAISLLIMTSTYFYIIRNLVVVNGADVEGTVFGILMKLIVIATFLVFTSFVVGKFDEIETEAKAEEDKETKRNLWTIGLIVGVISVIAIGNSLSTYASGKIDESKKLNQVKTLMDGDGVETGFGDDRIDIISQ